MGGGVIMRMVTKLFHRFQMYTMSRFYFFYHTHTHTNTCAALLLYSWVVHPYVVTQSQRVYT